MKRIADTSIARYRLATPALDQWEREVKRGERRVNKSDALWVVACWERSALNAHRDGCDESAQRDLNRAREKLADALQKAS